MENNPVNNIGKEQKQVNRVYAANVAMIIFSCVPSLPLQVAAFVLLLYVMGAAYGLRAKYPEESLVWNHMVYLIRTFWISSLFFLVGFIIAVAYLTQKIDMNAVGAMSDSFMNTGRIPWDGPLRLLTIVSLVTMGPSLVYFIYRVARGLSRAIKGYRMNNVRAWF